MMPRYIRHSCGCYFDARAQPFKRVNFQEALEELGYIPLALWREIEVLTFPCPWHMES